MKGQSKTLSGIESVVNAAIGILLSFFIQIWLFPYFGIYVSAETNMQITMVFFAISFIRSYCLRRLFNNFKN
jgi:hypothetical protein